MFKIDSAGATVANLFTKGDPLTGTPATVVSDEWLNAIQTELVTAIVDAGITLNKSDSTQLKAAINAMITAKLTATTVLFGQQAVTNAATGTSKGFYVRSDGNNRVSMHVNSADEAFVASHNGLALNFSGNGGTGKHGTIDQNGLWKMQGYGLGLLHFDAFGNVSSSSVVSADFGTGADASGTQRGTVNTASQTFAGLKTFSGGLSNVGFLGTNPEVGGSSPFILTVAHNRFQVINPATAVTVRLPTTGVLAGETWTIMSRSTTDDTTIASSDGTGITAVRTGFVTLMALQATPTAPSHWLVINVSETYTRNINSEWSTMNNSGGTTTLRVSRTRHGVQMHVQQVFGSAFATAQTNATPAVIPSRFCPTDAVVASIPIFMNAGGYNSNGHVTIGSSGTITIEGDSVGTTSFTSGVSGGHPAFAVSWPLS